MAYDTDIYKQNITPDILGSVQRGLSISDALQQRQAQRAEQEKQSQIKQAYQGSLVFGPNGEATIDQNKFSQNIAKIAPEMLPQIQQQQMQMQGEQQKLVAAKDKAEAEYFYGAIADVKDNKGWQAFLADSKAKNHDVSKLPQVFSPQIKDAILQKAIGLAPYLEQQWKAKEFGQKEREISAKKEELYAKNNPNVERRLKDLNSGDKARLDNSKLGLEYTQKMDDALSKGDYTFSAVGDNNFTKNLRLAAEAFGRMQSGGAINKEEEARFIKMAPTSTDSKEIQKAKLEDMQKVYIDRLGTLGFKPEEVGLKVKVIQYGSPKSVIPVGTIDGNHKFKGGDPNKQENWELVN